MWLCLSKRMPGMYFVQCSHSFYIHPSILTHFLSIEVFATLFFTDVCSHPFSICANFFTSSGFHVFRLNNPEPNHSCWCGSIYSFHCHMNGFSSRHIAIQRCSFFSLEIRVLTLSFDCSAFIIHIECEFVCVCTIREWFPQVPSRIHIMFSKNVHRIMLNVWSMCVTYWSEENYYRFMCVCVCARIDVFLCVEKRFCCFWFDLCYGLCWTGIPIPCGKTANSLPTEKASNNFRKCQCFKWFYIASSASKCTSL